MPGLTILTKQRVQLRLRENAGDLRGQGDQEGLFAFVKLAQFALLHNQHAEQLTPLDNRARRGRRESGPL